ncbi:hypothetical protein LCGC14_1731090 [marine sediment metagenome]|uniref:Uncharacterized protein n=1 Tax=marine sediment metagenome TaxID=412755 RepID=A0A0F9HX97_9ZZZZ
MKKFLLIALVTILFLSCESDVPSSEPLEDAAIVEPRTELAFKVGYKQAVLDMMENDSFDAELFKQRLSEFRKLLAK